MWRRADCPHQSGKRDFRHGDLWAMTSAGSLFTSKLALQPSQVPVSVGLERRDDLVAGSGLTFATASVCSRGFRGEWRLFAVEH